MSVDKSTKSKAAAARQAAAEATKHADRLAKREAKRFAAATLQIPTGKIGAREARRLASGRNRSAIMYAMFAKSVGTTDQDLCRLPW